LYLLSGNFVKPGKNNLDTGRALLVANPGAKKAFVLNNEFMVAFESEAPSTPGKTGSEALGLPVADSPPPPPVGDPNVGSQRFERGSMELSNDQMRFVPLK